MRVLVPALPLYYWRRAKNLEFWMRCGNTPLGSSLREQNAQRPREGEKKPAADSGDVTHWMMSLG
jgi:hypothetical protein